MKLLYFDSNLKFVLKGPIDNKSALFLVMSWIHISDKPLPEPKPTHFTDVYAALVGGGGVY